jgi:hypothetical protein
MSLSELTAPAVNQAIEEFKQLKRKAFLKKVRQGAWLSPQKRGSHL